MGQQEILDLLEKNKDKEFSGREIEEALDRGRGSLSLPLFRLRRDNCINYRKSSHSPKGGRPCFIYSYKENRDAILYAKRIE